MLQSVQAIRLPIELIESKGRNTVGKRKALWGPVELMTMNAVGY